MNRVRRVLVASTSVVVLGCMPDVGTAQSSRDRAMGAERGARVGGMLGAVLLGALGATIGQGICDAGNCTDAWKEGLGPSFVLGGAAGGVLGALLGTALPPRTPGSSEPLGRPAFSVSVSPLLAANVYQSRVTNMPGVRIAMGVHASRLGGEVEFEHHRRADWRGTGVTGSAVLSLGPRHLRSQWRAGVSRFSWTHPGEVPLNDPQFPGAWMPGTVRDDYLTPAFAFGITAAMPGPWSFIGEGRWHHRARLVGDFYRERTLNTLQLGVSWRRGED